mmetsp:Transcript_10854/g.32682  ORF Transcript_10854/g.32682 Transcript_10854/m.32682 type:complete len:763 (-) Transcript_10854:183-2471(-)
MLRFLCKLRESEIIEPLIPSIKACLIHRHSYVRKNAALAVYHIHKYFGSSLIPDGAELMGRFISAETELGSRRNAFLMLFNEAEELAIEFLRENAESLENFGDGFALLVLELTRKVCRREPIQKSRFVRFLFQLIISPSAAVSYEAAWTLASLSSAPTAIRAAASTYTALLWTQSDNNVKLIVLERLAEMKERHMRVLSEVLMDMLRALSSPNVEICKRTLEIALDMENKSKYRTMLIKSIHKCAIKFPDIAGSVVHNLMDFLGADGANDVIIFVRSIIQQYPSLRVEIVERLLVSFRDIVASSVLATALWILGEYIESAELLENGFEHILANVGEWSTVLKVARGEWIDTFSQSNVTIGSKPVVLPDGTSLQSLISAGDIFLGTVAAGALAKLACKTVETHGPYARISKKHQSSALVVCCYIAQLAGRSSKSDSLSEVLQMTNTASADSLERLGVFANLLLNPTEPALHDAFLVDSKLSFSHYLEHAQSEKVSCSDTSEVQAHAQADDLISWRQLRPSAVTGVDLELCDERDLMRATGMSTANDTFGLCLSHVYQLSGFADPVYAEASVTVHDYDIVLDILIVNRTQSTLTNLAVELATMGDLKLVERPQSLTVGPLDHRSIRANIKVSSTETGHIFGTVVYEKSSTAEKAYINLNNIHLDIMDYIRPATCSDQVFRHMWSEFEWENKVAISTNIQSLHEFLEHIVASTNMCCLTPKSSLGGVSSFLAANLYAKSIFNEDALVNVSVEKKDDADGRLSGYI